MNLVNEGDYQQKNPVTLVFDVGIYVSHFEPPYFFDHGTVCVIASCRYRTTCVLTSMALPSMWSLKF